MMTSCFLQYRHQLKSLHIHQAHVGDPELWNPSECQERKQHVRIVESASWAEVTSMQKELGVEQSLSEIRQRFLDHFADVFGYHDFVEASASSGELNVLNGLNDLNF